MAYIKKLKENELVGGKDITDVYPISSTQAIYRQDPEGLAPENVPQLLEESLQDIEKKLLTLSQVTVELRQHLEQLQQWKRKMESVNRDGRIDTVKEMEYLLENIPEGAQVDFANNSDISNMFRD